MSKARNKFRDKKFTELLYMSYFITFPDGDVWIKQKQMSAHDMAHEIKNMIAEHSKDWEWRKRGLALWKAGECWWKDNMNVEHLIILEKQKRKEKWGIDKAGLATFKTETETL